MLGMTLVGYGTAVLSAVFNGSFAAISKLVPQQHPFIFNALLGVGVFLSSALFGLLVVPLACGQALTASFDVDPVAALSGVLLGGATTFSFLAIPRIGLALAQGIWGGTAITVSFLWGEPPGPVRTPPVLTTHTRRATQPKAARGTTGETASWCPLPLPAGIFGPAGIGASPQSALGSSAGVATIICGVLGIVFLEPLAALVAGRGRRAGAGYKPMPSGGGAAPASSSLDVLGVLSALTVGLCGGSILVPASLVITPCPNPPRPTDKITRSTDTNAHALRAGSRALMRCSRSGSVRCWPPPRRRWCSG